MEWYEQEMFEGYRNIGQELKQYYEYKIWK